MRTGCLYTLMLIVALLLHTAHSSEAVAFKETDVHAEEVDAAIVWAMDHLRNLSESAIFRTLNGKVLTAAVADGHFTRIIKLNVQLSSTHLNDADDVYSFIVFKDVPTGETTLAINDFPIVTSEALEDFWRKMIVDRASNRIHVLETLRQRLPAKANPRAHETQCVQDPADLGVATTVYDKLDQLTPQQVASLPGSGAAQILEVATEAAENRPEEIAIDATGNQQQV